MPEPTPGDQASDQFTPAVSTDKLEAQPDTNEAEKHKFEELFHDVDTLYNAGLESAGLGRNKENAPVISDVHMTIRPEGREKFFIRTIAERSEDKSWKKGFRLEGMEVHGSLDIFPDVSKGSLTGDTQLNVALQICKIPAGTKVEFEYTATVKTSKTWDQNYPASFS